MKKVNILFLLLLLVLSSLAVLPNNVTADSNGFTFTVFENEQMEEVAEITGYTGTAYTLTIPETVSDENGT